MLPGQRQEPWVTAGTITLYHPIHAPERRHACTDGDP